MAFNLTPEEFACFHAYIQQGGSLTPLEPTTAPTPNPSAIQSGPSASATQPLFLPVQQTQVQAQPLATQPAFQPTQFASSGPPATQSLPLQQTQAQSQPLITLLLLASSTRIFNHTSLEILQLLV